MQTVVCSLCRKLIPDSFAHDHHVRPQAAGGTSLDETTICSGCHSGVHMVAHMLMGRKASQAEDHIRLYYQGDRKAQAACMKFAIEVATWMQRKRDGLLEVPDPEEEVPLPISLPLKLKNALAQEAATMRHPSGRVVGMSTLASSIIADWLYRKYPSLRTKQAPAPKASQKPKSGAGLKPPVQKKID